MRGVIYARYSSDAQREESIEGQLRENTAYAKKNGIEIVGTYIDRAVSAKTDNRPEFQRMVKDSAKKGFDVVVVWKLDRFARNRFDSARYTDEPIDMPTTEEIELMEQSSDIASAVSPKNKGHLLVSFQTVEKPLLCIMQGRGLVCIVDKKRK